MIALLSSLLSELRNNRLSENTKIFLVYLFSGGFILVNTYLIYKEMYWAIAIPILIITLFYFIFSFDKVLLLIIFITPFSVKLKDAGLNVGVSLPAEPLMLAVLLIFLLKIMFDYQYDRKILRHVVAIAILLNLLWIFITSVTSQIPVVSFKFFVARLWFVIPMFFVLLLYLKNYENIRRIWWYYATAFVLVIFYTITNHYLHGFAPKSNTWVMDPFFNDHTAYGAALCMFIPLFGGFVFNRAYKLQTRAMALIFFLIMVLALILSFSRAAWVSLAVALPFMVVLYFKIRFRYILLSVILFFGLIYVLRFEILNYLAKNEQDSSAHFIEHVRSITNITTDASNLERVNRWQSAFRMFDQRPVFGYGPGTYQFLYAPYQRARDRTIITTNFGDVGNAHSEYIGPLAESGLLGMLTFVFVAVSAIATGVRVYRRTTEREIKIFVLGLTTGLITYLAHGLLNNFLDTDKLSVPFWGFVATLVALDLFHVQQNKKKEIAAGNSITTENSANSNTSA